MLEGAGGFGRPRPPSPQRPPANLHWRDASCCARLAFEHLVDRTRPATGCRCNFCCAGGFGALFSAASVARGTFVWCLSRTQKHSGVCRSTGGETHCAWQELARPKPRDQVGDAARRLVWLSGNPGTRWLGCWRPHGPRQAHPSPQLCGSVGLPGRCAKLLARMMCPSRWALGRPRLPAANRRLRFPLELPACATVSGALAISGGTFEFQCH